MYYSITRDDDHATISAFLSNGENVVVSDQHPNFDAIAQALLKDLSEEAIRPLLNPGIAVGEALAAIDVAFEYRDGHIYFDQERVHDVLEATILDRVKEGDTNWEAYARFIAKLAQNPSYQSRLHLFEFIRSNGLQVNLDGDIVAYKKVKPDWHSGTAGSDVFVDGVLQEGHVFIPNHVGSLVSIDRRKVDDDRLVACSVGLHVGAYEYADKFLGYGHGHILAVSVNPRDVVSVPRDESDQKIRVCRYYVVQEVDRKQEGTTIDTEAIEAPVRDNCKECGREDLVDLLTDIAPTGELGDWVCEDCFDELDEAGQIDTHGARISKVTEEPEPAIEKEVIGFIDLSGLRSLASVLEEIVDVDDDVITHDAIVSILQDEDDLGNSAAAKAINLVTEPLGFTTTRDSVRRWRTANL